MEPLFSALYRVPKKLRQEYCKVKILEILLSLALIHEPLQEKRHYYTKAQVERIKSIQQHILADISAPHTVASLAHQHGMALTSLKKIFSRNMRSYDTAVYSSVPHASGGEAP